MTVNRIQIKASLGDKNITIPISQNFDEVGREQLLEIYDEVELQDNINPIIDYETTRYSHLFPPDNKIYYKFQFRDYNTETYNDDFTLLGYTQKELAKKSSAVNKSFFKLDYYDSPVREEQKLMFSVIMPLNNCIKVERQVIVEEDPYEYYSQIAKGIIPPVYGVYSPTMILGPNKGINETYYIQWLKKRDIYDMDTFYMSCKFFNAKTGKVIKMINESPPNPLPETYDFRNWFYYQVKLNINPALVGPKYYYEVRTFNINNYNTGVLGQIVGREDNPPTSYPIRFYEYINP